MLHILGFTFLAALGFIFWAVSPWVGAFFILFLVGYGYYDYRQRLRKLLEEQNL